MVSPWAVSDEIDPWTAAEMLGCCAATIRRYVGMGILSGKQDRRGARLRISRKSVLNLLARMRAQANALKPLPWRDE